jgi:hypothetical protein
MGSQPAVLQRVEYFMESEDPSYGIRHSPGGEGRARDSDDRALILQIAVEIVPGKSIEPPPRRHVLTRLRETQDLDPLDSTAWRHHDHQHLRQRPNAVYVKVGYAEWLVP